MTFSFKWLETTVSKGWRVFVHEYRRHVLRRGFLFVVFGFPGLMILIIGGIILYFEAQGNNPVGVVDEAGFAVDPADYDPGANDSAPFILYATEAEARQALADESIQAFLLLPASYIEDGEAQLYYHSDPYEGIGSDIRAYLRAGWLVNSPPAVAQRFIEEPLELRFNSLQTDGGGNAFLGFLLPYITSLVFYVGTFTTAGY